VKSNTFYFLLLFVISFAFRLILILVFQFDGLYGQDSYAYYDYAHAFYTSFLNLHVPPNFYWPIGYYALTALLSFLTGGDIGYAALLISLNAGALCSGVVYLLAYELLKENREEQERKKTALYAGLIVCFTGILVKSSIVIMSDGLGLLFASLCMLYVVKYYRTQKLLHITLSWIFLAFAVMTRYAHFLFLIPFLVCLAYIFGKYTYNRATVAKHFIFALFAGFIVFLPQLYYIIKYGIAYLPQEEDARSWVMGWSPLNFFSKDFSTRDGTMHYRLWNSLYYLSPVFHPLYLSVFGFAFLYGLFLLIKKKQFQILSFFIIWNLFLYFYLAGSPYQSLRYTLSYLPGLAIISAIGLSYLKFRSILLPVGIAALIIFDVYHIRNFAEEKQNELSVVNWVNNNVPSGAQLFSFDITPTLSHYSKIKPHEFYFFSQDELINIIDSSKAEIYFIMPEEKLNTQWKDLPIEKNFNFLKLTYNLFPVAELRNYRAYRLSK
jgi:4-amino-4-deoxy-L-arabinose transferase-like glycosyltransferase